MTIRTALFIGVNADQAKGELRALQGEVAKTVTGTKTLDTAAKGGAAGVTTLATSADAAAAELQQLAAAQAAAASAATAFAGAQTTAAGAAGATARANRLAAGSVGNLIAQFNDIGVMTAAGQDPLMMMIQQGSQITQVIGPLGAAGAVKALGAAFVGMLNPVSLVTLAVIAFGATAAQWLIGADEKAVSLGDRFTELSAALKSVDLAGKRAGQSVAAMIAEFGTNSPGLRAILEELAGIEKIKAFESLKATSGALRDLVLDLKWFDDRGTTSAAQDFLGLNSIGFLARRAGAAFADNLELLRMTEDPAVRLKAALDLKEQMASSLGSYREMNGEQRQLYEGLTQIIVQMKALRITAADSTNEVRNLATANQIYGSSRSQSEAALADAEAMNAELEAEASIRSLINEFGESSRVVAVARLNAERAVQAAMVDQLPVADDVKAKIMANWEAANALPNVIDLAATAASQLAAKFATAARNAWDIAAGAAAAQRELQQSLESSSMIYSGRGGDPRTSNSKGKGQFIYTGPKLDEFNNPKENSGDARGRANAAKAEAEAVANLLERLREERDILQETDPVKQALIRHREELKNATAAERAEIEKLIATEIQLKAERAAAGQAEDFFAQSALSGIQGILFESKNLVGALKKVASAFLDAALQAVFLGKGPLSGFFGITTSLFGGLLGGPVKKAAGGMIYGDGGGTADKVPVMMSPGEFAVNARSTARYRPVLERINAGADLPGFAAGGIIGGGGLAAFAQGRAPGGPMAITVDVSGARGNAEIEEAVFRGAEAALSLYRREGLALDVRNVLRQGGRVTG